MMKGWKTWTAAVGLLVFGATQIITDKVADGIQAIIAALGLVGLGHKVDKGQDRRLR